MPGRPSQQASLDGIITPVIKKKKKKKKRYRPFFGSWEVRSKTGVRKRISLLSSRCGAVAAHEDHTWRSEDHKPILLCSYSQVETEIQLFNSLGIHVKHGMY